MNEAFQVWLTLAVFALTYLGLALGRLPGLRTDRAGIALVGAALMMAGGVVSFREAVRAVDFETIVLLLGMMVVVAYLRRAGFFARLAGWTLKRVRTPHGLLGVTVALAGLLSAVLVNDVVCLALTPLLVHLARHLRLDPKPHLLALALASNVGSAATPTGNPQNMIIGGLSHIGYARFAARLAPVSLVGLVLTFALVALVYRSTLRPPAGPAPRTESRSGRHRRPHRRTRPHTALLVKSVTVTVAAVALFLAGAPMALVALGAAAVLLLDRVRPAKVYRHIDWGLLVMFAGLFVVVHAFEVHVLDRWDVGHWPALQAHPVGVLSLVSAALSNLVSNVPAVLLFKPVIPALPVGDQETAWLALAMSSTFAGNLTILGSVANLIVVENARREGVGITLGEYCKVGVPVTAVTLALGVLWLRFVTY
jgi:Na+/H+ antiporter NhaD/arsenite permease-like protein